MGKIIVVGSGVVGTATGKGFLHHGHEVSFIDIDAGRLRQLSDAGYSASAHLDLSGDESTFVFLALPTPHVGRRYDLSAFVSGVKSVGAALGDASAFHTVVIRSTVPPGTAEDIVLPTLERESGRKLGEDFALASAPEFLRAASAVEDFLQPWMTVIASRSRRTVERLEDLFKPFGGIVRTFSRPSEAEMVKCAHNIYNATKISFWNEMWLVARDMGLNADSISETVALSAEGSTNPGYGIHGGAPYGGVCLPKDTNGFIGFANSRGLKVHLLEAVVRVNEQLESMTNQEMDRLGGNPPKLINLVEPRQETSATAGGI